MRKTLCTALVCGTMLLSGCIQKTAPGFSEVKSAKERYESLDSAHITMTDLDTGLEMMEFSFYFNKDDEMIFSYCAVDGEKTEQAYSDGAQFFYKTADEDGWRVIKSDDESYLYNLYTRTYRYPYARGSIFFLDGTSVSESNIAEAADGGKTITYVYDPDGLNSYAAGRLDNVSNFSALTAEYVLDAQGYIVSFTETGTVTDAEGQPADVNIRITVDSMNEVYEIPYPVGELILD
ncbi:MAG: hypothetical protein ACI4Q4_07485 [Oscillospiraceae bacterium]